MGSGNFRINIVARVLVLVLLVAGLEYCLSRTEWVVTPVIITAAIVMAVAELISHIEKTNREFTNFLHSIKDADFTIYNTSDKRGKTFSDFKAALNIITGELQHIKIEKEAQFIFLQSVVEHLSIAILCFDATGEIMLINDAARQLLGMQFLKNIKQADQVLYACLTSEPGLKEPLVEIKINGEDVKLSIRSSMFTIQGVAHTLLSLQNIRREIENTELQAWEQLLRVLTHEIMNSVTPISSLSASLKGKADALQQTSEDYADQLDDLSLGLDVIARRSAALISFVNLYKSMTLLPSPTFRDVAVKDLFDRVLKLKHRELQERNVAIFIKTYNEQMALKIDEGLVEQVLINIINNAVDALASIPSASITFCAFVKDNRKVIQVSDNGTGIDSDHIDKIFVPFFTTKNKGSGIGLSLSKQIMSVHSGSISATSLSGSGTTFTLSFP